MDPDVEWAFTCSFDTKYEISKDMTVDDAVLEDSFSVSGAKFDFSLDFYQTTDFQTIQASPSYQVGQQINYAIAMNSGIPLNKLQIVTTECLVSNGSGQSYPIMASDANKDKCPNRGGPLNFRAMIINRARVGYSYNG